MRSRPTNWSQVLDRLARPEDRRLLALQGLRTARHGDVHRSAGRPGDGTPVRNGSPEGVRRERCGRESRRRLRDRVQLRCDRGGPEGQLAESPIVDVELQVLLRAGWPERQGRSCLLICLLPGSPNNGWRSAVTSCRGGTVNFAEGAETQQEDMREIAPSVALYSSRLWESQAGQVQAKLRAASRLKRSASRLLHAGGSEDR